MAVLPPGTWVRDGAIWRCLESGDRIGVDGVTVIDPQEPSPTDPRPDPGPGWHLWCSQNRDGTQARPLAGATLKGPMAIWLSDKSGFLWPEGIKQVVFTNGTATRTEKKHPFCPVGSNADGPIRFQPPDGANTIVATVTLADDSTVTVTTAFTVAANPADPIDPVIPDPGSNDRFVGDRPTRPIADLVDLIRQAGTTAGKDVLVEPADYTGSALVDRNSFAGWVNIISKRGPGGVRILGKLKFTGGDQRVRFMGVDVDGQIACEAAGQIHWWHGRFSNADGQSWHGMPAAAFVCGVNKNLTGTNISLLGCRVQDTQSDLIHVGPAAKVLIQGCELWAGGRGEDAAAVHGTSTANTVKMLDTVLLEGSGVKITQAEKGHNTTASTWYLSRSWVGQGCEGWGVDITASGRTPGPTVRFGDEVFIAERWASFWDWLLSWWCWGSKSGSVRNVGGTVHGTWADRPPAKFRNRTTDPARSTKDTPATRWREAHAFNTWRSFFAAGRGGFDKAEGGRW